MKSSGKNSGTAFFLRTTVFMFYITMIISNISLFAQNKTIEKSGKKATRALALTKCWVKTDSSIIKIITKEDMAQWTDNPPFRLHCDNEKVYHLKFYEFTVLSLNPFENKSYGVGDDRMIPILARKAINNLKNGDTVILKNVELANDENTEVEKLPTISFKIAEKEPQK